MSPGAVLVAKEFFNSSVYSCMSQLVFVLPSLALPSQKINVFLYPIVLLLLRIGLLVPLAFHKPSTVVLLGRLPFGYFLSLRVKKYQSLSLSFNSYSSKINSQQINYFLINGQCEEAMWPLTKSPDGP